MPVRHRSDPEIKCRALVRPLFSTTQRPCASQCHLHSGSYIHTHLTYLSPCFIVFSLPASLSLLFPFSLCYHHRPPCMGLWEDKEPEKGLLLGIENWMEQVSYLYEPATKALQSPTEGSRHHSGPGGRRQQEDTASAFMQMAHSYLECLSVGANHLR